jgi:hypothetical protein
MSVSMHVLGMYVYTGYCDILVDSIVLINQSDPCKRALKCVKCIKYGVNKIIKRTRVITYAK